MRGWTAQIRLNPLDKIARVRTGFRGSFSFREWASLPNAAKNDLARSAASANWGRGGPRRSPFRFAEKVASLTRLCGATHMSKAVIEEPEKPSPWPSLSERAFVETLPFRGAWIANRADERLYRMIKGFREAGDLLVSESHEQSRRAQNLIYPAIFAYRQSLELRLKQLLVEFGRFLAKHRSFERTISTPFGQSLSALSRSSKAIFSLQTKKHSVRLKP